MANDMTTQKRVKSSQNNKFRGKNDKSKTRQVKAVFMIVTEGTSEKNYFEMDCFRDKSIKVEAREGDKPDPAALIKTAEAWLSSLKADRDLQPGDQAWIILDEDDATDEQLAEVFDWVALRKDRGVGFTVPQFEYWLLLHFDDGKGTRTQREVEEKLKQCWPNYHKTARPQFTVEQVNQAVGRASVKVSDTGVTTLDEFDEKIGRHSSVTTVHFLVELILASLYGR